MAIVSGSAPGRRKTVVDRCNQAAGIALKPVGACGMARDDGVQRLTPVDGGLNPVAGVLQYVAPGLEICAGGPCAGSSIPAIRIGLSVLLIDRGVAARRIAGPVVRRRPSSPIES